MWWRSTSSSASTSRINCKHYLCYKITIFRWYVPSLVLLFSLSVPLPLLLHFIMCVGNAFIELDMTKHQLVSGFHRLTTTIIIINKWIYSICAQFTLHYVRCSLIKIKIRISRSYTRRPYVCVRSGCWCWWLFHTISIMWKKIEEEEEKKKKKRLVCVCFASSGHDKWVKFLFLFFLFHFLNKYIFAICWSLIQFCTRWIFVVVVADFFFSPPSSSSPTPSTATSLLDISNQKKTKP